MHIVISWDIKTSEDRWSQINENMKEALKPYSWIRPLSTLYIVQINGENDRRIIHDSLVALASSLSERVHFVMTPIIASGRYNGLLPKDMWPKINERTN